MAGQRLDQFRQARDQASQRLDIYIPIIFTTFEIGLQPVQIFKDRLPVSSLTFQAVSANTGRIQIGIDSSINDEYGYSLTPGASVSWAVTLTDILQTLGWSGVENQSARGEIIPNAMNRFRQPRLVIDAAQFWAIATADHQYLTAQFSTPPRY